MIVLAAEEAKEDFRLFVFSSGVGRIQVRLRWFATNIRPESNTEVARNLAYRCQLGYTVNAVVTKGLADFPRAVPGAAQNIPQSLYFHLRTGELT